MNTRLNSVDPRATDAKNVTPITQLSSGTQSPAVQALAGSPIQLDQQKLNDPNACIAELNKRYAVVKMGGKAQVVDENGSNIEFLSFPDFQRLYNNISVPTGPKQYSPLGQHWLNHSGRRQYLNGIVFDPELHTTSGQYNLWKGFAVMPQSNHDCSRFLEHLKIVICSDNDEHYKYFLNWLALLAQKPWLLPQVAIVLLSEPGAGKGLLMQYLGKILGPHYKHLTSKSHLVGSFSGHLQDAVLVFADELSWDGNKAEAGMLKGLITEPTRMMEKKFVDAFTIKNCTHLIVASNESFAVPAEISDRRYCVFEVSSCKIGDHAYFEALIDEMCGDGPSGLLALLLNRDISSFKSNSFPKTAARLNQQLQSLDPIEQWLVEQLQLGTICTHALGNTQWPERLSKKAVYDHFRTWYRQQGNRTALPNLSSFTSTLRKYGISRCRMPNQGGNKRPWGYKFPPLDVTRETFDAVLGCGYDWEASDDQ